MGVSAETQSRIQMLLLCILSTWGDMHGLLDMLDPPVAESGHHRGGARVALECLAHHSPHASSYHYGYAYDGY